MSVIHGQLDKLRTVLDLVGSPARLFLNDQLKSSSRPRKTAVDGLTNVNVKTTSELPLLLRQCSPLSKQSFVLR